MIISKIEQRVAELLDEGDKLLQELESIGWHDTRPERTEARVEPIDSDLSALMGERQVPATVRLPASFVRKCNQWYTSCLALMESNMKHRVTELAPLPAKLKQEYMDLSDQLLIASNLRDIQHLIASIPAYLRDRLYDLRLEVEQAYAGDELTEATVLLKARHFRAAGALAGVTLERHLKLLCDRYQPPIKYSAKATISPLNDSLKNAGVYDQARWRKVQWMGDIRNECDHSGTDEPKRDTIQELIAEVKKFVALFVI